MRTEFFIKKVISTIRLKWFPVILMALLPVAAMPESKPAADLVITNAKVWTGDPSHPAAEAVAVIGDRIVAVGSATEIDAWRGPQTRIIDAGGKLSATRLQRCSRAFR